MLHSKAAKEKRNNNKSTAKFQKFPKRKKYCRNTAKYRIQTGIFINSIFVYL